MPAVYAHFTFGQRVLRALPDGQITDVIRTNLPLFEIGLQGPDILFFYRPFTHHPVNRIGHKLHDQSGLSVFDRQVCRQADIRLLAYILGFICHYALDSECHTLVEYYMERTGKGHSDLETDLDRYLMILDGLDPFHHVSAGYIRDTVPNAEAIASFFDIKPGTVKTALTSMKLAGYILVPSSSLKHKLLTFAGHKMGEGSVVSQLTMDRIPDPIYNESNRVLMSQLEQSVPVAIALMENFMNWYYGKDTLSQRFQPTFSFDEEELLRLKERDTRV